MRSTTCAAAVAFACLLAGLAGPASAKPKDARPAKAQKDAKAAKGQKDKGPAVDRKVIEAAAAMLRKKAAEPAAQGSGRAIALLRGASALSQDPAVFADLALAYQRAGQFDLAAHEYRRYASLESDPRKAETALAKARDLDEQPRGFADSGFHATPATQDAVWAFGEGQKRFKKNNFREAIPFFQAALLLDPGQPGPYRMLGVSFGKIGEKEQEQKFLVEYLRVRPDGAIADTIRKLLTKGGGLGYLTIEASYPCDVTINGRDLQGKLTPIKKLPMPPGGYSISLGSDALHGQWNIRERVVVEAGKESIFKLPLGVLQVRLDPWARIRVDGKYRGSYEELGLRQGEYRVHLESSDGTKTKDVTVMIQPGQRFVIDKW
jgi:tetratricopeptide (TPR) repeat protein